MAPPLAITGCAVRTPLEHIFNALILVDRGVVSYVGPLGSRPIPTDAEILDLGGLLACPGFIDLQVNGLDDNAVMAAEAAGVSAMAAELASRGTTSFLPTLTTSSQDHLLASASAVRQAWETLEKENTPSSSILGVHLEGPYFSKMMAGVHPPEHIRPIDIEEIERIAEAAGGWGVEGCPGLGLVTLSPELDGAPEAVRWLGERGVLAAMGHTAASADRVENFISAGGAFAVHAYNRYGSPGEADSPEARPSDHRSPGPMASVSSDPRLMAGIIADGVHVHPEIVSEFVQKKGWFRTVLTSDLVSGGGLSGEEKTQASGFAVKRGGVLTGSRLSVGEMIPLIRKWCRLDDSRILALATRNPANLLGAPGKRGSLRPGARADICFLDPDSLEVSAVMAGGEWVSGSPPHG
jgi:N-acetylglucosamine-6-phosphate deacetylase